MTNKIVLNRSDFETLIRWGIVVKAEPWTTTEIILKDIWRHAMFKIIQQAFQEQNIL